MKKNIVDLGDKVTLTIKGTVVDPNLAGTSQATHVRIDRASSINSFLPGLPSMHIDVILDKDAEVTTEVTSRFKNGVHIDTEGRYWMRRPDGWHKMMIHNEPAADIMGRPYSPSDPQRLKEDNSK